MSLSPRRIGGPRGLLRAYVLYRLSLQPMSGYDLISDLDSVMGGTWRPGSGSIYPILEELKTGRLIGVIAKGKRSRQVYSLTARGRKVLHEERKMINQFAAKWNRIRLALLDLVSAENLANILVDAARTNKAAWSRVLRSQTPKRELLLRLREYRLILDDELQWVDGRLRELAPSGPSV